MYRQSALIYLIGGVVLLGQCAHFAEAKKEICYQAHFVKLNVSDSPPRFMVKLTGSKMGNLSMFAQVNEDIPVPFTKFAIIQSEDRTGKISVIYNMSRKACEFLDIINRMPMVKTLMSGTMKTSNFSFQCPMRKGVYAINNLLVRSRNPLFSVLYNPKKTITVYGGTSEQLPDMSLKALSRFMIQMKIVRKKCEV